MSTFGREPLSELMVPFSQRSIIALSAGGRPAAIAPPIRDGLTRWSSALVTVARRAERVCLADQPEPRAIRAEARDAGSHSALWTRSWLALRQSRVGTRSGAWPCRRERTHAVGTPSRPSVARLDLAEGWPGTDQLHPGTTRECPPLQPLDRPIRSAPFASVFASTTVTTPVLRFRCAVPVGHHVRVRWYELPASSSTRRVVLVPTCGNPFGAGSAASC
jgi:hypothetical protein